MDFQQWVNLQDHRQVKGCPGDNTAALCQGWDESLGAGIQGADGVVQQHEVALVHQPVDEEVVDLGNDGGRDVGWPLTGQSEVDPILAPFLDDLLKQLKPVVLPNLMFTGGLFGQYVVSLINYQVQCPSGRTLQVFVVLVTRVKILGYQKRQYFLDFILALL